MLGCFAPLARTVGPKDGGAFAGLDPLEPSS